MASGEFRSLSMHSRVEVALDDMEEGSMHVISPQRSPPQSSPSDDGFELGKERERRIARKWKVDRLVAFCKGARARKNVRQMGKDLRWGDQLRDLLGLDHLLVEIANDTSTLLLLLASLLSLPSPSSLCLLALLWGCSTT